MSLGLVMHLLNGIYFKLHYDIYFEFIPRFCFLMCTFGYLVFMIFYKWNRNWAGEHLSGSAPTLLNELIYMFLPNPNPPDPFYTGKKEVERVLVIIALISIPLMFFPKPILLHLDHKAKLKGYDSYFAQLMGKTPMIPVVSHVDNDDGLVDLEDGAHGHGNVQDQGQGHHEEHELSELMVHQGLETIEFVLGCISHTASYLRLWALSLAHSELATVFWEKIYGTLWGLGHGGGVFVSGIGSFIAFSGWFAASLLVILGMESLSAFLHTLRLHWVEFQSKFYRGDGYPFLPFSYHVKEED